MITKICARAVVSALAGRTGNFIDDAWESRERESFSSRNPADGTALAQLPRSSRETARRAIASANAAQPAWARVPAWERADMCARISALIHSQRESLATILSLEQGKPYAQALSEVGAAGEGFQGCAEQVKYLQGEIVPGRTPGRQVLVRRAPRGVYAVITPWNYPVNIPVEYIAPGIATGNTIVWVPAPSTSLCAVALMRVLDEAGLPAGVVNMVLGDGPTVGDEIVASRDTHAIGFTGSTATGRTIAQRASGKPMILELGGNGPLIVRRDADLDLAAKAAAIGAFSNAGQICSATGRVLADASIAEELGRKIAELARAHVLGDPLDPATTMGPLNNATVMRKTKEHVEDALRSGAVCLAGGKALPELGSELFHEPTVLVGVRESMRVAREETFGPVVPIVAVGDDQELIRAANDSRYGLSAAIISRDLGVAAEMAAHLFAGTVNINESTYFWEGHTPFGGGGGSDSGMGRVGGRYALEAMTEVRTLSIPFPRFV